MQRPKTTSSLRGQLAAYSATSKSTAAQSNWGERLGSWPTYCTATAAALAGATSASAGIIYSGTVNISISLPPTSFPSCGCGVHTYVNPVGLPPVATFSLHLFHRNNLSFNSPTGVHTGAASIYFPRQLFGALTFPVPMGAVVTGTPSHASFAARNLSSGAKVPDNFGSFAHSGGFQGMSPTSGPVGQWEGATSTGFAGVKFFAGTTVLGTQNIPLYDVGWLRIRVQDLNADGVPDVLTLIDYAYNNDPAGSINAGQTAPEPGTESLMLLAAGFAGVLAWKRRRKKA